MDHLVCCVLLLILLFSLYLSASSSLMKHNYSFFWFLHLPSPNVCVVLHSGCLVSCFSHFGAVNIPVSNSAARSSHRRLCMGCRTATCQYHHDFGHPIRIFSRMRRAESICQEAAHNYSYKSLYN